MNGIFGVLHVLASLNPYKLP